MPLRFLILALRAAAARFLRSRVRCGGAFSDMTTRLMRALAQASSLWHGTARSQAFAAVAQW